MNNELKFENDMSELTFGAPQTKIDMNYENATNKPSINGVELIGNKTTEELGIKAGSDIELITELKPESIEEELKENQVYNGNAIHDLARLFGMTLEELKQNLPNIIKEFDIEKTYEDNDVYNANATHQLAQLFGDEITQIQEGFGNLSNNMPKIKYIETKDIYLDEMEPGVYWNRESKNINIYLKRGATYKKVIKELENQLLYVFYKESDDVPVGTPMVATRTIENLEIKDTYLTKNSSGGLNETNFSNTPMVYVNGEQTIKAKKTFTVLPESEIEPTLEAQLVNKAYVDNEILKMTGNLPSGSGANIEFLDTDKIYLDSIEPGIYYLFKPSVTFYGKTTDMYGDKRDLFSPILVVFNKNTADLPNDTKLMGIVIKDNQIIKNYVITSGSGGFISNYATSVYYDPMWLAGSQTITGIKTFSKLPETSVEPTKDTQFVNKAYIDAKIAELEAKLQA